MCGRLFLVVLLSCVSGVAQILPNGGEGEVTTFFGPFGDVTPQNAAETASGLFALLTGDSFVQGSSSGTFGNGNAYTVSASASACGTLHVNNQEDFLHIRMIVRGTAKWNASDAINPQSPFLTGEDILTGVSGHVGYNFLLPAPAGSLPLAPLGMLSRWSSDSQR